MATGLYDQDTVAQGKRKLAHQLREWATRLRTTPTPQCVANVVRELDAAADQVAGVAVVPPPAFEELDYLTATEADEVTR